MKTFFVLAQNHHKPVYPDIGYTHRIFLLKPCTFEADWDGSNYSSGVYFYKLISNDFVEIKKMVLMK